METRSARSTTRPGPVRWLGRTALAGALACPALLAAAPNALAGYGPGAQYQIEISDNSAAGVPGNGAWLWIELNANGTGDYAGAICIHAGSAGLDSAESHTGDLTWSDTGGTLAITGIRVIHGTVPLTITVPDTYGHYTEPSASVMTPDIIAGGTAEAQVAP
jgi:hypothetical protein